MDAKELEKNSELRDSLDSSGDQAGAGASSMEVSSVTITVKAASQSVPDMFITALRNWTVADLKRCLSEKHVLKPAIQEQRLIHSGHLLTDDCLLSSALHLDTSDVQPVVHLVCKLQNTVEKQLPLSQSSVSQTPADEQPNEDAGQEAEGLRHRTRNTIPTAPQNAITTSPNFVAQYYATYYLWQMQMAGHGLPANMDLNNPPHLDASQLEAFIQWSQLMQNHLRSDLALGFEQNTADAALQPHVEEPQPAQPPNNLAGGQEEEAGGIHDWLDSIYILARFGVFAFFIYFYSTVYRFALIITVCMLIYLYHVGWFRPARAAEREQQLHAPDPQAELQQQRDTPVEQDPLAPAGEEEAQQPSSEGTPHAGEEERPVSGAAQQRPLSILTLSWTFVTSFFTSMIPEQPQLL